MQRVVAAACVTAGVFVLAGFGWALLAAGTFLWLRDDRAEAWLRVRAVAARGLWARWRIVLAGLPRRSTAVAAMAVGLVLAPVGAFLSFNVGVALMVAAVLLLGYSVISGEGA